MASSGNFCVMNAVLARANENQSRLLTLSRGNLHTESTINDKMGQAMGTHAVKTGKWYTEWYIEEDGYPTWLVGWFHGSQIGSYDGSSLANVANFCSMGYATGTYIYLTPFGNTSTSGGTSNRQPYSTFTNQGVPTTGDVIMNCMDFDAGKGWWGINGVWGDSGSGAGDPANDSNPNLTWTVADYADHKFPITANWAQSGYTNGEIVFNAGQDSTFTGQISAGGNADSNGFGDFKYAPPSGFLALCSANLPISDDIDPAQTDDDYPSKQCGVVTYTGNQPTGQTVSGLGFKPDLIWAKMRNSAQDNQLYDSSRLNSRNTPFMLRSNSTGAEIDDQAQGNNNEIISSFDTDGFTLGGSNSGPNDASRTYVAWCWRANGGTEVTNNDGTGTSYVQANQKAGFSIVRYQGTGSALTVGHGLAQEPDITIIKDRDASVNWIVYTKIIDGSLDYFFLNTNGTKGDSGLTGPNSSIWNFNSASSYSNTSSRNYIMYNWHSVEGYSKFGSYTGNGNTDGPFIYTGFRPRILFIKGVDNASNWEVRDTARDTFNPLDTSVLWDSDTLEAGGSSYYIDVLSNGVKIRTTSGNYNTSGNTYIFGAWGDVPFKYNNTF